MNKLTKTPDHTNFGNELQELFPSIGKTVSFNKSQSLFIQNDPGDSMYLVLSGSVEICIYSKNGKKISLNFMQSGDLFGEIATLDGGSRTASATAVETTILTKFDRADILELISTQNEIAIKIINILCKRIRWINQQVEDFALLDTESRLANRLLILHQKFANNNDALQMSQSELADFLGLTRESTNKILQSWRDVGIIEMSRGSIKVKKASSLTKLANKN